MAERHVLCCDCDACLGPGIPDKAARISKRGRPLPHPTLDLRESASVVSFSPELTEARSE